MTDDDRPPLPDEPPDEERYSRTGSGRVPPQNIEAEASVLGSMMLDREAIETAVPLLDGPDFYRPAHEAIFDAILDLYGVGTPVDPITVAKRLTEVGTLAKVGGAIYLHDLTSSVQIAAHVGYHASVVRDCAVFRRMVEAGTKIAQRGYSQEGTSEVAFDAAVADLMRAEGSRSSQDYVRIGDVVEGAITDLEARDGTGEFVGVPTGFYDLDELLQGLRGGQMVVLAGRPAMGKSTLGLDIARYAALRARVPSAIFSLEMSREEIIHRLLSAEARVPLANIRSGLIGEENWTRIAQQYESIASMPLWIDDSASLTPTEIWTKARRLKQQENLGLIVIDYMQLMTSGRKVENRQAEVSEFSRQIKLLAKELDVPVIALSQLNRGVEGRASKRPMMSDLRESGSIEQDADIIVLLHREDMYEQESSRPGEADLIVAKNRNGPTRDVTVVAQLHYSRFVAMAA